MPWRWLRLSVAALLFLSEVEALPAHTHADEASSPAQVPAVRPSGRSRRPTRHSTPVQQRVTEPQLKQLSEAFTRGYARDGSAATEYFLRNREAALQAQRALRANEIAVACPYGNATTPGVLERIMPSLASRRSSFARSGRLLESRPARRGGEGETSPPGCKQTSSMTLRVLQTSEGGRSFRRKCVPAEHRALFGPPMAERTTAASDPAGLGQPVVVMIGCGSRHDKTLGVALLSLAQHAAGARVLLFVDTVPQILRCQTLPLQISFHSPKSLDSLPDEERYACSSGKFAIVQHPEVQNKTFVLVLDADVVLLEPLESLWQLQLEMARRGALFGVASEYGTPTGFGVGTADGQVPESCARSSRVCPVRVNTGVLLLNLAGIRERGITSAAALLAGRNYSNFSHDRDQILLNGWLASRPSDGFVLPCRWNRRTDSKCVDPYGILHGNRNIFVDKPEQRKTLELYPLDARHLKVPVANIYNDCLSWLMKLRFVFEWHPWHDWHQDLIGVKRCQRSSSSR